MRGTAQAGVEYADAAADKAFAFPGEPVVLEVPFSQIPDEQVDKGIIELGGYPNFTPLYQELGYEVVIATRMRKALAILKKCQPDVIVTEFNFQSDFRDRTSSLESLLAVVQRLPATRVIVFYEKEFMPQFD